MFEVISVCLVDRYLDLETKYTCSPGVLARCIYAKCLLFRVSSSDHQMSPPFLALLVSIDCRPSLLESVRLLYQGMLRTLLVLLHDFPEFLSDYHLSFCDVIPPSCIQLRNLVLAAFPRSMRLPDPFTPNLKVSRA